MKVGRNVKNTQFEAFRKKRKLSIEKSLEGHRANIFTAGLPSDKYKWKNFDLVKREKIDNFGTEMADLSDAEDLIDTEIEETTFAEEAVEVVEVVGLELLSLV